MLCSVERSKNKSEEVERPKHVYFKIVFLFFLINAINIDVLGMHVLWLVQS